MALNNNISFLFGEDMLSQILTLVFYLSQYMLLLYQRSLEQMQKKLFNFSYEFLN